MLKTFRNAGVVFFGFLFILTGTVTANATTNAITPMSLSDTATITAPAHIVYMRQTFNISVNFKEVDDGTDPCFTYIEGKQGENIVVYDDINPGINVIPVSDNVGIVASPIVYTVTSNCGSYGVRTLATATTIVDGYLSTPISPMVFPSSGADQKITYGITTANSMSLTILLAQGSRLVSRQTTTGKVHSFFYIPSHTYTPDGTYTLTAKVNNIVVSKTFKVMWGWMPFSWTKWSTTPLTWKPCRTISWYYNPAGSPTANAAMVADLKTTYSYISKYTGLVFKQVSTKAVAQMVVDWTGTGGADGYGGYYGNTNITSGFVRLNPKSNWVRTPGFGTMGRGSLLLHETGHAIGLGHVVESSAVMTPTHNFGVTAPLYTMNDVKGLHYMYQPQTCPTWSLKNEPTPYANPPLPSAPQNATKTLGTTYADLKWAPPVDYPGLVKGYWVMQVVYYPGGMYAKSIKYLPASARSFRVARLATGTTYYSIQVESVRGAGGYSDIITVPHK